jgi:hypothetical protein
MRHQRKHSHGLHWNRQPLEGSHIQGLHGCVTLSLACGRERGARLGDPRPPGGRSVTGWRTGPSGSPPPAVRHGGRRPRTGRAAEGGGGRAPPLVRPGSASSRRAAAARLAPTGLPGGARPPAGGGAPRGRGGPAGAGWCAALTPWRSSALLLVVGETARRLAGPGPARGAPGLDAALHACHALRTPADPPASSRTLKVRGGIISKANKYRGGFCSSQRIFPPQIIQVLLSHPHAALVWAAGA